MKKVTGTPVKGKADSDQITFYGKGETLQDGAGTRKKSFIVINDMNLLTGTEYEDEDEETPDFSRAVAFEKVAEKINAAYEKGTRLFKVLAGKDRPNNYKTDDGELIENTELVIRKIQALKKGAVGAAAKASKTNQEPAPAVVPF